MKMVALQSGSNGNCIYVEADGVRLLFDAGISGKQAEDRLAARGRDIRKVDALLISHEHRDHSRCMGTYQRKYGIPIHVTRKTLAATQERQDLGEIKDIRHYSSGTSLQFGAVTVETIPTPHDGVDGVAFVVDDGRHRLGILTDLGHKFGELDA
ncbi:MAG: MBL fold metallo-hydrolase, partial [Planctomycetaceae bacterium]